MSNTSDVGNNWIAEELKASDQNLETFLDKTEELFPYIELEKECDHCIYTCKGQWNNVIEHNEIQVGPLCAILWKFSPSNPMRIT